jgi:NitT/TauT family transport system permease protein
MGKLLIPILDILQSVPVLGFISITVVFFMSLAPGRVLGAEFAAIFAIFTSQAWNMAFSFYQSLRTLPTELMEAADSFHLTPWMRFWRLEVPFAMPALVWNMMMSMSGGWFFVVASEAINVGHTTVALPGIGSFIALAIEQRNMRAIGWAIATMFVVILTYDQLFFRPLVAWCDRFRVEQEPGTQAPQSWALTMMRRSRVVNAVTAAFNMFVRRTAWRRAVSTVQIRLQPNPRTDAVAQFCAGALLFAGLWHLGATLIHSTTLAEAWSVVKLAFITMLRVFVLIALASAIWLPAGIWVGLRPRVARWVQPIAQFLAAFPANLLFPVAVYLIVRWRLHPDVWLSPLMILGTQWYILFNVIAGAAAMPAELRHAAENFGVRRWLWWKRVAIPGVLPYYVTGAITASGGSWNAAIVAELASWGDARVQAHGLGAYIAEATQAGDFHRIALGIAVMCVFVTGINRFLWRPLYEYAERKFRYA